MKHQDQKSMETLDSRMSEHPKERQGQRGDTQPYRAPQVFLVGKAKHLMASDPHGNVSDSSYPGYYSRY